MEEIVNLIGSDSSASDISDRIKDVLYAKAAERINTIRPTVGASMFGDQQSQFRRIKNNDKNLISWHGIRSCTQYSNLFR